jgi:putative RNA 2'-phosphotransferase
VDTLLEGIKITHGDLNQVVENNNKKRFEFNEDRSMIRATQGHSVKIDLGYQPEVPPDVLYHGTVEKFLPHIMEQGLLKGQRHDVHLSPDIATAANVGGRRGKPVVLIVDAKLMHDYEHLFYVTSNVVWLTDHVPPRYLKEDK